MTQTMTQPEMAAHDARIYRLMEQEAKLTQGLYTLVSKMHVAAGDEKTVKYGHRVWSMSEAEVMQVIKLMEPTLYIVQLGQAVASLTDSYGRITAERATVRKQINDLNAVWLAQRWSRFYPCLNSDGHIHRSRSGCPTVRFDTAMGWDPSLSGKTEAEAVEQLDEGLCSVCFPSAPVALHNHVSKRTRAERAERAADKAERELKKAAKTLAQDERFRDGRGDRVETVAAAKQAIRDAIEAKYELAWTRTQEGNPSWADPERYARVLRNRTENLAEKEVAAETAARVLEAREREHAGWGADAAEIDRIRQSAEKRAAREWSKI